MTNIHSQLLAWSKQIGAIAQTALANNPHIYDRERYEQAIAIAARITAIANGDTCIDSDLATQVMSMWKTELTNGSPVYASTKVGCGAVMFNEHDELFLIKRGEGQWFIPTGWSDIGISPAQTIVKEMHEEVGLEVTPLRIIGIYDSTQWRPGLNPHLYSIVFYCRYEGGELKLHPTEVLDAGYFARDALPSPMFISHKNWLEHAWQAHRGECIETFFDQ